MAPQALMALPVLSKPPRRAREAHLTSRVSFGLDLWS